MAKDDDDTTFLADRLAAQMDKMDAKRVAAVCTDGTAVAAAARRALFARPGFGHVIEVRCMMEALSFLAGSVLGHPRAVCVVASAQRVTILFRGSQRPLAALIQRAKARGAAILEALKTANWARPASVHGCLDSVLRLEGPLRDVLRDQSELFDRHPAVAADLRDGAFWGGLRGLCALLAPLTEALSAVRRSSAGLPPTLADLTWVWLDLAKGLARALETSGLDPEYLRHVAVAYDRRVREMNAAVCLLALFLDPRYRHAVDDPANLEAFNEMVALGCTIMKRRGFGQQAAVQLARAMQLYKARAAPFNLLCGGCGDGFNVRAWWLCVSLPETEVLVKLAFLLLDVVPHGAAPERALGLRRWFRSDRRTGQLSLESAAMIAAIKMHYEQESPLDGGRSGGGAVAAATARAGPRPAKRATAGPAQVLNHQQPFQQQPPLHEPSGPFTAGALDASADDDVIHELDVQCLINALSEMYREDTRSVSADASGPAAGAGSAPTARAAATAVAFAATAGAGTATAAAVAGAGPAAEARAGPDGTRLDLAPLLFGGWPRIGVDSPIFALSAGEPMDAAIPAPSFRTFESNDVDVGVVLAGVVARV
ncbi:unnamed protein product [Phaeothamnion confervicola]